MRVYGHLRDQHLVSMAQRVTFSRRTAENLVPFESGAKASAGT